MNDAAATLLLRYADEGSEPAFAELVRTHLDLVYSAALRRVHGDPHRAAEVAQQVFTKLAREATRLSQHTVLTAWLYTTTRNAAIDLIRAEQRRIAREQEAYTMQTVFSAASPYSNWERLSPVLDGVMDELNDGDRTAVLLRFFEKRAFAEIGAALNLSEDAARMRTDRALDKLRVLLAKRHITSTTAALSAVLGHQAVAAAPAGLAATVTGTALASTGSAAMSALNSLQFMSGPILTFSAVVVVALLAIGTATREVIASHEAHAVLAAATRERDALNARLRDLERRAQRAEQSGAVLQTAVRDQRAAKAAAESRAAAAATAEAQERGRKFLDAHPAVRQALVAEFRARCVGEYAALYKILGLTAAEIEQFEALAPEVNGPSTVLNGRVIQMNPGTGMSVEEAEERRRALLGEDRYQKMLAFEKLTYARTLTTQLASALCFTDAPLTAAQAGQMVDWMGEGNIARRGRKPDWDGLFAKAQSTLAPAQLTALAALRTQHDFDQAVNQAIAGGK